MDNVTELVQTLSPLQKALIQPIYDKYFKIPIRTLMTNQMFAFFEDLSVFKGEDSNHIEYNFLEPIISREDHNSVLETIKTKVSYIPSETLFWIRRHYDGTSDKFLQLFNLIMKGFDPDGFSASSKLNFNTSIGQSPYTSYHKNGKLKETGPGYNEAIRYKISAKSGLNLRENPDLKSKKIAKIPYNTVISLKDKPGIKLTVFDTDKKTGITKPIEGEWVKIGAEFYLSPGDEGYAIDQIDPSSVEGYVFDGFIEKEKYLVKKQGLWTYYYESGVI